MKKIIKSSATVALLSLLSFSALATEQDPLTPKDGDDTVTFGRNYGGYTSFGLLTVRGNTVNAQAKHTMADPTINTGKMKMDSLTTSMGKMKMMGFRLTADNVNSSLFSNTVVHKRKL